jgi:phosphatidylserine decarboxylase
MLNHILTTAPQWHENEHSVGLVGVPVNALLDWPMATRAGFVVFQDPKVNKMMKKVLNTWGEYLSSSKSASVLGTGKEGWFGPDGTKALTEVANLGAKDPISFEKLFHCDPKADHHGFKSWDDFFTRTFRWEAGIRPVADPDNDDVLVNCCESKTYKVAQDVKARDKFWVKGQPYSVVDMLAQDPLAEQFVGGTVYQAFLSALSYHRWHTPVSGTIKKSYVVEGTYFSEPLYEDFTAEHGADKSGECTSQEYISVVATRSIIFIEADNPKIGLMCFMGIGMTEVSTCETTVKEGQHVNKGDQLG